MFSKVFSLLWGFRPGGVTDCVKRYSHLPVKSKLVIHTVIIQKRDWGSNFYDFKNVIFHIINFKYTITLFWFFKLIKLMREIRPSILFAHSFNSAIISFFSRLFYNKSKFICSYHGIYIAPVWYKYPLNYFYNQFVFFIYKYFAHGIVCVSEYSANELISRGIARSKIKVIYNGIPNRREFTLKVSEEISENIILITICRLVPLKGIETLISAVKKMKEVSLYIIGDGPLRKDLEKLAEGSLCKIIFKGTQYNIDDWLSFADIFVLPSFVENHSISLLEAMRAGKAIIASNVGGNPESIRDGIDGLLFEAGNTNELQTKIEFFCNNINIRTSLGISANNRFNSMFTEEIMLDRLSEYFKSL